MKFDVRIRRLGGTFAEARVARFAEAARQLANTAGFSPPVQPLPQLIDVRQPSTPSTAG
jgi:hypothetical protein